jgi:hypothetical protein
VITIRPSPSLHQPYFASIDPSSLIVARQPPLGSRPATSRPFGGFKPTAIDALP